MHFEADGEYWRLHTVKHKTFFSIKSRARRPRNPKPKAKPAKDSAASGSEPSQDSQDEESQDSSQASAEPEGVRPTASKFFSQAVTNKALGSLDRRFANTFRGGKWWPSWAVKQPSACWSTGR